MSDVLNVPMLRRLVPGGIDYGANLLVEFEPDSLWYDTSLTIAAHAVRAGIGTDYHTFQRAPNEIRKHLERFELNVKRLEQDGSFRILDSYTGQTGLGYPEAGTITPREQEQAVRQSVKLSDWSISMAREIKAGILEENKKRLHIDDNTGVLLQYNEEKVMIDLWRTRVIPFIRACEVVALNSLVKGVASDTFHRQFESLCDGIIDFRSEEREDTIRHYVRVRGLRGKAYDSRWQRLQLFDNGEVKVAD